MPRLATIPKRFGYAVAAAVVLVVAAVPHEGLVLRWEIPIMPLWLLVAQLPLMPI